MTFISLWPPSISGYSHQVDLLVIAFTVLIVALSAPVFILIAVFAVKYRRGRPADRKHSPNRNIPLEVSWSVVPFVALLGFYVWSTELFASLRHAPADALQIDVVAKQWMWKFQHPQGQAEINELHVPAGEPVKLTMASQDVIHSLFLPALRIKQDVVPGRYTTSWFTADKPGVYRIACSQYCGSNHSEMTGSFVVMTPADYAKWLSQSSNDLTLAAEGAALFRSRGCSGCHDPASTTRAPSLVGLYGNPVPLQSGEVVIADDQYIRDSILLPQSQVAAGYQPIMPTFQNVLSEEDVLKIVAYIKSLQPREATQ
ncbi:cytochrome c oxidase subunit II [Rhizobium leucaenae]|uniref:cytochrome-c oxidase n=1 Tax=Rhizobium leucaenae TaxID=29450 RepID=A0A7W7EII2_9HYPH|nr:cytochrome c oxidase subunit II [Rhizobium leucaenae]MBB4566806.1 cytochrome c oxidase subunit 2 [Rhizobium leucaenae]MBB6300614.1 cytochrome c oxidase subunit 2 [Rhizobium leucaenae]